MKIENLKLKILRRQLERGVFPHAYLFSGADEKSKEEAIGFILDSILGQDWRQRPHLDHLELNGNPITIDDIRDLKARAYEAPIAGGRNVFVIRNLENLSRDASPALLKILEDPPNSLLILATTQNRNLLLSTMKSRFSSISFYKRSDSSMDKIEEKARSVPDFFNLKCFEEALWAHRAMDDPTMNKRLLGEYLAMLQ